MNADNLIVVLGAIAGTLTGAISVLFKSLIDSKDNRIDELVDERDYWRDATLSIINADTEHKVLTYEDWLKQNVPPAPPPKRPGKT